MGTCLLISSDPILGCVASQVGSGQETDIGLFVFGCVRCMNRSCMNCSSEVPPHLILPRVTKHLSVSGTRN